MLLVLDSALQHLSSHGSLTGQGLFLPCSSHGSAPKRSRAIFSTVFLQAKVSVALGSKETGALCYLLEKWELK